MKNTERKFARESLPERENEYIPESKEDLWESALERGASLEKQVDEFDLRFGEESSRAVRRLVSEYGLSGNDLKGIPEIRLFLLKLDRLDAEARLLRKRILKNLAGLRSRCARYLRGISVGAVVSVALLSTDSFSAWHEQHEQERVKHRDIETPSSDDETAKKARFLHIEIDEEVSSEIGQENYAQLTRMIESYDVNEVYAAIEAISGVNIRGRIGEAEEIHVVTAERARAILGEEFKLNPLGFIHDDINHIIYLVPGTVPDELALREIMYQGLVHENIHCETVRNVGWRHGSSPMSLDELQSWDGRFAAHFEEGLTELMTRRVLNYMGRKYHNLSYSGGPVVLARILETLIGEHELATMFFDNNLGALREALVTRLGEDGANRVLGSNFYRYEQEMSSIRANALDAALDLVQECQRAGFNVRDLIMRTESDEAVLGEHIWLSDDGRGLFVSRTPMGNRYRFDGIVEDDRTPVGMESWEPIRIHFYYSGMQPGPASEEEVGHVQRNGVEAVAASREYETTVRERLEQLGGVTDQALGFVRQWLPDMNLTVSLNTRLTDAIHYDEPCRTPPECERRRQIIDDTAEHLARDLAYQILDYIHAHDRGSAGNTND